MSTGYRIRTHLDSGNARIGNAAGNLIPVLDDLLTSGASPWTKTTNGTNDITYTAPAGSQIKFRIVNNTATATTYHSKCNGQVGAGTVFPTATQEGTTGQGFCAAKARNTTVTSAVNDPGYIGIRTDRFFLLVATETSNPTATGWIICGGGDIPVLNGSDPGLCIVVGNCRLTTITTTATSNALSITADFGTLTSSGLLIGYAEKAVDGTTGPVGVTMYQTLPCNGMATIANSLSDIILGRTLIATHSNTTATVTGTTSTVRGYIPWLFVIANSGGGTSYQSGDTFSDDNGATYQIINEIADGLYFALMTSDGEGALP